MMEKQNTSIIDEQGQQMFQRPGNNQLVPIKKYDFRKPDKFSRDQIKTLDIIHDTFARLFTNSLSAMIRALAHHRVVSVDQFSYGEFIRSIPNPTCISIINMDPFKGAFVLEIDLHLCFALIDRIFGGKGITSDYVRDLTDIEQAIMEGIIVRTLGNIREAWGGVSDLYPRLTAIECNPQFASIVPPTEVGVVVTMETRIAEAEGKIHLCYPYPTLNPIMERLTTRFFYTRGKKENAVHPVETVSGLKLGSELYYKGEKLGLDAIYRLKKGSCIRLPGYEKGDIFLENGGVTVMKLKYEKQKGTKEPVFRVEKPVSMPEHVPPGFISNQAESEIKEILVTMRGEFSQKLTQGLANLGGEISQLRKKQDELAEQIFFESTGKASPVPYEANNHKYKPFSFANNTNAESLCRFIEQEHPQMIAMILSYLSPEAAARILMLIPPEIRLDVVYRIANIDRIAPEVLRECERVLEKKLGTLQKEDFMATGGIMGVVNILNSSPRSIEKEIIAGLDKEEAELSEEIKKRMFVFEDIMLLDKKTVKRIIKDLQIEELAIALKKTDPEVNTFIRGFLSKEDIAELDRIQEAKTPLKITDIEDMQQRIVAHIREMEEKGEIIVVRPEEIV